MNDSVVVYRSFYEASKTLTPEEFKELWINIFRYSFDDEEPEKIESALAEAIFVMAQPQIDANKIRRSNGSKGGAPKGNQNAKKQPKQPMVELKNNQRLFEKQANVNVNVNDNVNVNVNNNISEKEKRKRSPAQKQCYGEYKHVKLTEEQYIKLGVDFGEVKRALLIKRLDEYIQENPKYKSQEHNLAIRRWVVNAIEEDENKKAAKKSTTTFHEYGMKHNYDFDAIEQSLLRGD